MTTLVMVAAPFLIAGLLVGLAVALLQTATQIQESVLAFVPKLIAALLVLALAGNLVLDRLTRFAGQAIGRAATTAPAPSPPGGAPP